MSEQIGWLCYTETGARHFIWKADDAEEQAWLDKHYPRREPVYTGPIALRAPTKEAAKGALLHSVLQLHVCREGHGGTIEEAKDNAQRADEWVGERLQEHGLTWADLQADWREFYKDEIERHRRSPQERKE